MRELREEGKFVEGKDGVVSYHWVITDELLGVSAFDDGVSPYVDLYVEGATVPFDTVNVWCNRRRERVDEAGVLNLVIRRFYEHRLGG